MPIPNISFSRGAYFGTINGYKASDFEPAYQNNGNYRRAVTRSSSIYFVTSSGSLTDLYTLAYMPFSSDDVRDGSQTNSSYFNKNLIYSSGRVGDFIRIDSKSQGRYPLSLALKGYRVKTIGSYEYWYYTGGYGDAARIYDFWSRRFIEQPHTSNSTLTITLTTSTYKVGSRSARNWTLPDGTATTRQYVGVALQAGGGAGGKGWWGHDGGGASAGAFWCGIVYLGEGSITITVEAYNATGDGKEGSRITLSRGGSTWLLVERGQYPFGNNKGTSQGGSVTFYSGNYTTFAYSKGGNGAGNGLGTGTNLSTFYAQTPDQSNIPFAPMGGGFDAPNGTGSGGGSVIGRGANGGGWNTEGADAGVGLSNPNQYGAGGGGGGWWGRDGGSGGYPYFVIGY